MSAASPRRIRGWHVLAALLSFFGVVIAVNATFIVLAVGSFPGEDVRRSYTQGLRYNQTLSERAAQARRGWRAQVSFAQPEHDASVQVILRTNSGEPLQGASLSGALQWPTDARRDRALPYTPLGDVRYASRLADLPAGRWRLRARAEREDGALDFESDLTWPPSS